MEDRPTVDIVVVNWNGWEHTIRCLDSLRKLDYPNSRVIAVDNGSTDGSPDRIRAAHPEVELIAYPNNLGYAGGSNIGIRLALERGAEYVWVLNNDIVVEPHTLSELISVARCRSGIGVVAAAVWQLDPATEPRPQPEAFRWRGESRLPAPCPPAESQNSEPCHLVDDVAGSNTLLDAKMLHQIGLFDERFFHYWEDVELCVRARREGWLVAHACRTRIWHAVGGSLSTVSAQSHYYNVRNWLLFARWTGRGGLFTLFRRAPKLTVSRIFGRRWLLQRRWRVVLAGLLGAADGLRGRYGQRAIPRWLG